MIYLIKTAVFVEGNTPDKDTGKRLHGYYILSLKSS